MKVTRVYADAAGESHFESIDIPLRDAGEIGRLSERQPVASIIFRENDADYDFDWHHAPQRQYIVLLEGELEVTVGDGTTRRFGAGQVLLAEDLEGRGHISRRVDGKPGKSLFVTID